MKPLLILAVGVIIGYLYGFDDARTHEQPLQRRIAAQIAHRAGGASRDRVSNNIDDKMKKADRQ